MAGVGGKAPRGSPRAAGRQAPGTHVTVTAKRHQGALRLSRPESDSDKSA